MSAEAYQKANTQEQGAIVQPEHESLIEDQSGTWLGRNPRALAAGAALVAGLVATAALWPGTPEPTVTAFWPGFHAPPAPPASRQGWAKWTRLDEIRSSVAAIKGTSEKPVLSPSAAAALEATTAVSYEEEAGVLEEEEKPRSKGCNTLTKEAQKTCSKTAAQREPDMAKICDTTCKCHEDFQAAKKGCPPDVGAMVDRMLATCGLEGGSRHADLSARDVKSEEEELEEGFEEIEEGPSHPDQCNAAMEKVGEDCGLKQPAPDMEKLCADKGACPDAMQGMATACKSQGETLLQTLEGVCEPCTAKLMSFPPKCQRGMSSMVFPETCKDEVCDIGEACADVKEVMGLPPAAFAEFRVALDVITEHCGCSDGGKEAEAQKLL